MEDHKLSASSWKKEFFKEEQETIISIQRGMNDVKNNQVKPLDEVIESIKNRDLAHIRKGIEQAQKGNFASEKEVKIAFERYKRA